MQRWLLLVTPLTTLFGCSPEVSFSVNVSVEGVASPQHDRLHVAVSVDPSVPVAAPWDTPFTPTFVQRSRAGDALNVTLGGRGSRVTLDARFWYDVDGDGVPSQADRVGRLDFPVIGEDRGFACGNMTTANPVVLAAAPSGTAIEKESER